MGAGSGKPIGRSRPCLDGGPFPEDLAGAEHEVGLGELAAVAPGVDGGAGNLEAFGDLVQPDGVVHVRSMVERLPLRNPERKSNLSGMASTTTTKTHDIAEGIRKLADFADRTPLFATHLSRRIGLSCLSADEFVTLAGLLDGTLDQTGSHLLAIRAFGPVTVEVHIATDTLDLAGYDRMVAEREALNEAIDAHEDTHDLGAGLHWSGFDTRAEYAGER